MTATLMRVDDAADRALDPYLRIRERDLVGRDGLFVAEGEVVVRVLAFESPYTIRSLLLEQRRVEAMRDVVEHVPADVPAYVVPQKVMDAVVGFHIHRGVLAIGDRGDALHPEALLLGSGAGVIVGLVGLANHDNVGGIFRNAAAFGARGVLVDAGTCDPLYRKAVRVSVGGALVVPFARCESENVMLDVIERAGYEAIALTPRGEISIDELPRVDKRALLLGTEGDGLPDHVLRRACSVRIDMAKGKKIDSLNVAVASGIALHAVTRR
jgi:tRNA G18 (ribose-2'-O)-methylase SpoU